MSADALSLSQHSRGLSVLFATGIAVGVADIVYAFVFYGALGAKPVRILQSIAAGLLGRASYGYGTRSAVLGLFLHFFIALCVTFFYYIVAKRFPWLNQHVVVSGLAYGAGVFIVMHSVVIPLSARPAGHLPLFAAICEFTEHMLLVGLPIALANRWTLAGIEAVKR